MKPNEIRENLNRPVRFTNPKLYAEGAEYILTGAVFRRDPRTGEFFYQAELTDRNVKHSVIYCRLEEIERSDKT
jgi:hypothetical protein